MLINFQIIGNDQFSSTKNIQQFVTKETFFRIMIGKEKRRGVSKCNGFRRSGNSNNK